MSSVNTRSAFVALVGRPNVGKSSLLNQLVGQKVAIVSDKPQTTRNRIMGVLTRDDLQLVFLDTPGAHRPRTRLGDFMVKSIGEAVGGVDAGVLVVTADAKVSDTDRELLAQFRRQQLPVILVINKIDLLEDKSPLLTCIDMWQSEYDFEAILPISALTGEAVDTLVEELSAFAFESPHFFPTDTVSDQPERVLASELVREQMLHLLQKEIPHGIAVVVEKMGEDVTEKGQDIMDIEVTIYCEKDSHKGIVIGKRGAMLKEIASRARAEMEDLFGIHVNLQCWVKVKEDWRNRQGLLGSFGYTLQ
ncbi:MAG: GTPase Era [Ruminococcaceae bacterium]|nr:GTPase Era [Oscillospiraceae bacterium]